MTDLMLDRVRSSVQILQDQCCHSFLWESLQICRPCQTELTMLALGKRALRLLMRNPVGPDKRSLFGLFTEFQEHFSSPSSHGPPAGLHNRVASGHSGHAPHSYPGEGETVPTWQISATLTWVPTSGAVEPLLDPSTYQAFITVFVFSLWFCSPGGSGPIQKSQTSGSTASTITSRTPGCAPPPVRTVDHKHVVVWAAGWSHQKRLETWQDVGILWWYIWRFHVQIIEALNCPARSYPHSPATLPPDWQRSVQALMVLSVVFSSISFLGFLVQLLALSKGQLFYFTGLCQAFAGM